MERSQRLKHFVQKLETVLCEVIKEENSARLMMEQKIELRRREIADMCQQLGLAPFLPERGLTSSELMRPVCFLNKLLILYTHIWLNINSSPHQLSSSIDSHW
ncbi:unnamed protein product [Schistosoma mattheei]|uniref:Uncharacterized protein n=1 Tax=Schistosoma mattheei TaxID=31246 RepID=A0A3P8KUY1_9TREM|nr:unnamed protein product [Schistosoma mattheei]